MSVTLAGTLRSSAVIACALLVACGDDGPSDDPPGTMVELSYCLGSPTWVAVQDGDRPWTRVLPVAEGRYEPKFRSTRGGVAVVGAGGTGLQVNYGTLAELATIRCDYGYKDVMGTVAGVVYPQGAIVSLGAMITLALRDTVKLSYVADGPQDLFAAARDRNADVSVPARIIIRRDLDPPSNSSIGTLDFDSEAFPSALSAFNVINLGDAPVGGANVFWYGSGAARGEGLRGQLDGANSGRYQAVPLERLADGDLQSLDLSVGDGDQASRTTLNYFRAPADLVISMGPAITVPTVTIPTAGTTIRPRLQLSSQAEYGRLAYVSWYQDGDQVTVAMTSAYLGGTPATWDLEVPDLSSAEGWKDAWGFTSPLDISWFVTAEGGPDRYLGDATHDGDVFRAAYFSGSNAAAIRASRAAGRPEPHRGGFPQLPPR